MWHRNRNLLIVLFAWLGSLVLGLGYFKAIYPLIFHSDSASVQILAEAMLDEMRVLPYDFNYGNQLIIFRANFFIALALKFGMTGYKAYGVGSALCLSCYFVIALWTLKRIIGNWSRALLVAILVFLPLGYDEADFILGQQSHLANVVFSLLIATEVYIFCCDRKKAHVIVLLVVPFLMAVEAPTRALLTLCPIFLLALVFFSNAQFAKILILISLASLAGMFVNQGLSQTRSIAGIAEQHLVMGEALARRAGEMLQQFVSSYIGIDTVGGKIVNPFAISAYGTRIAAILAFSVAFFASLTRLVWFFSSRFDPPFPREKPQDSYLNFIGMLGVVGALFGFSLTAVIGDLEAAVRNALWALQFCKLYLVLFLVQLIINACPEKKFLKYVAVFVLVNAALAFSFVGISLNESLNESLSESLDGLPKAVRNIPFRNGVSSIESEIPKLMEEHNAGGLFGGNFWKILRLHVLLPGVDVGQVQSQNGEFVFRKWLTRPSAGCMSGNVLYLLGESESEREIADRVAQQGGKMISSRDGAAIYLGKPIWAAVNCRRND